MDVGTQAEIGRDSRRRRGALVAATVALVLTGVVITNAVSSRGEPVMRSGAPHGEGAPVAPTELETAVGWLDGLAAGLILPSDVTSRLDTQNPEMAKVVRAAWSDLRSSGSQARLHEALGWIDGLAAGLILPSDVTSRMGTQNPATAKIVAATWADLGSIASRPA